MNQTQNVRARRALSFSCLCTSDCAFITSIHCNYYIVSQKPLRFRSNKTKQHNLRPTQHVLIQRSVDGSLMADRLVESIEIIVHWVSYGLFILISQPIIKYCIKRPVVTPFPTFTIVPWRTLALRTSFIHTCFHKL